MNHAEQVALLERDDATRSVVNASNQVRLAIEKVARSQAWEIEGADPFPASVLPMLQEASRLLARVHAVTHNHAKQFVWPVRDRLKHEQRLEEAFSEQEP